jgi:heptosyltransferase-2
VTGEQRVLVVAPNWLGDAVMALPAIADVRRHFRHAELMVAARPSVAPVFSLAPSVDRVVSADLEELRRIGAGTAILLPNSFGSAWRAARAGIRERWGYATDLRRPLLSRPIRRPRGALHQGAYYQHLTRALGMASGPLEPVLAVADAHIGAARSLLTGRGWDGSRPLVVLAPGAAYGTAKRWPPAHFGRLVQMLMAERRGQCVLVGSAADGETARWVRDAAGPGPASSLIDLTGATSLDTLAAVLTLASACVSNDSGAMHLAGAVGTPLAALFGPTREHETAPLAKTGSRAEVLINPVWCRPCMLRECPIDHRCMKGLSPATVFAAVERLMRAS